MSQSVAHVFSELRFAYFAQEILLTILGDGSCFKVAYEIVAVPRWIDGFGKFRPVHNEYAKVG